MDRRLLNIIQGEFPLAERPYAELGERLRIPEDDVLARVSRLKTGHIIRQVSAIFDTRSLGYLSSLVAVKVDPARVDQAGAIISEHPGVSHNYRRNHDYNIWFTIALPPTSSLEMTVQAMHRLTGAEATRLLPTLRLFKIGVQLDIASAEAVTARSRPAYTEADRRRAAAEPLTQGDIAAICELQEDLAVVPRPWDPLAYRLGVPVVQLLEHARTLQASGHMRRFAAILYHRQAGFSANPMAVWKVPEEQAEEVGGIMASFNAVSHCYLRPVYPDWPYNLFTMIHGRKVSECEQVIEAIAQATGIQERALLYSTREYKKTRVRYFTPDLNEWEERHLARVRPAASA
ncbi:MAG: Lrp/AsnC family transcriptional regulator [Chloroflexi bacterium]|nr:Lrp/AsnC family transcriptional regulator [Chloroflexota bacterium]